MYHITDYTYRKAALLGVNVTPSTNKNKKIDVYKNGKKIASVGFLGAKDYPTYVKEKGLEFANQRRKFYKNRHNQDRHKIGSNGYYADQLLW